MLDINLASGSQLRGRNLEHIHTRKELEHAFDIEFYCSASCVYIPTPSKRSFVSLMPGVQCVFLKCKRYATEKRKHRGFGYGDI